MNICVAKATIVSQNMVVTEVNIAVGTMMMATVVAAMDTEAMNARLTEHPPCGRGLLPQGECMETNPHDLSSLFAQLGLPSSVADIEAFIASHGLPAGISLAEASFWNPVQAAFLTQALADDSDWSEAVDELAARLS